MSLCLHFFLYQISVYEFLSLSLPLSFFPLSCLSESFSHIHIFYVPSLFQNVFLSTSFFLSIWAYVPDCHFFSCCQSVHFSSTFSVYIAYFSDFLSVLLVCVSRFLLLMFSVHVPLGSASLFLSLIFFYGVKCLPHG